MLRMKINIKENKKQKTKNKKKKTKKKKNKQFPSSHKELNNKANHKIPDTHHLSSKGDLRKFCTNRIRKN